MKALISFLLMIAVVVFGITSYKLFRDFDYNASALLTITAYLSMVMSIYAITVTTKKIVTAKKK